MPMELINLIVLIVVCRDAGDGVMPLSSEITSVDDGIEPEGSALSAGFGDGREMAWDAFARIVE